MEGGIQAHGEEGIKETTLCKGLKLAVFVGQHGGCLGVESQSNPGHKQ